MLRKVGLVSNRFSSIEISSSMMRKSLNVEKIRIILFEEGYIHIYKLELFVNNKNNKKGTQKVFVI